MRFSLTLLALLCGGSEAFQPQASLGQRSLVIARAASYGVEESRWETMEKRTSRSNSGPGFPPGNYEFNFTPMHGVARDYESTLTYFAPDEPASESRWEEIDTRTSLRNSGPGAPRASYDISFTPLPPVARDYERTISYFVGESAGMKESRWDYLDKRTSLINSGSGVPAGRYDFPFTPSAPKARDYERVLNQYGAPGYSLIQSRWDMLDQRTTLSNSGSGAPVANYDVPFTPLPPVARDYERTISYYVAPDLSKSRWSSLDRRSSLINSGTGKPAGRYDVDFTPVPPRASEWYPEFVDSPEDIQRSMLPPASEDSQRSMLPPAYTAAESDEQLPGSQDMPLPGQSLSSSLEAVEAYNLNK